MYQLLAKVYDALVGDEEATLQWVSFVEEHIGKHKVIHDLACGSGDIAIELAKRSNKIIASDISKEMLEFAMTKDDANLVGFMQMDMREFESEEPLDAILCFCDSLNYLKLDELYQVFEKVYLGLKDQGFFLFDIHSMDRLSEFQEEYLEEGIVNHIPYEWSILAQEDKLYQNFVFFDKEAKPTYETYVQTVFNPNIEQKLKKIGFDVMIYTDFNKKGIVEGEKYFFVCRKENK